MDLRLPMGSAAPTAGGGWPTPIPAATAPEAAETPIAADEPHHDEEDDDRPRRRRGHRRATESFAEALARAEDPTRPELPGAAETAAAIAAYRDDAVPEGEHAAEAVLPREMPAAEPMPLPEEPEATSADPTIEAPDAVTTAEAATTFQAADTRNRSRGRLCRERRERIGGRAHARHRRRRPRCRAPRPSRPWPPTVTAVEEGGAAVEPMAPPVSDAVAPAETHVIEAESVPAADEEMLAPVPAAKGTRSGGRHRALVRGGATCPDGDDFISVEAPTDASRRPRSRSPVEAGEPAPDRGGRGERPSRTRARGAGTGRGARAGHGHRWRPPNQSRSRSRSTGIRSDTPSRSSSRLVRGRAGGSLRAGISLGGPAGSRGRTRGPT